MYKKLLYSLVLLLIYNTLGYAQNISEIYMTSDTLRVYFRQDKIVLDPLFRNNGKNLKEFSQYFNNLIANKSNRVRSILIVSGASPEGPYTRNRYLSDNRAKVVYDYLIKNNLAQRQNIEIESRGIDWKGLTERVENSNIQYKDEILEMLALPDWISKNGKVTDGRKKRLMDFKGGKVWRQLYDLYFADLRGTKVMIAYNIKKEIATKKREKVHIPQSESFDCIIPIPPPNRN